MRVRVFVCKRACVRDNPFLLQTVLVHFGAETSKGKAFVRRTQMRQRRNLAKWEKQIKIVCDCMVMAAGMVMATGGQTKALVD